MFLGISTFQDFLDGDAAQPNAESAAGSGRELDYTLDSPNYVSQAEDVALDNARKAIEAHRARRDG